MSSSTAAWCTAGGGTGGNAWKAPAPNPRRRRSLRHPCRHDRTASSHREAVAAAKASPCFLKSFSRSLALSSSHHARYAGSLRSSILCAFFHSPRSSFTRIRAIGGRRGRTRPSPPPPGAPHFDRIWNMNARYVHATRIYEFLPIYKEFLLALNTITDLEMMHVQVDTNQLQEDTS